MGTEWEGVILKRRSLVADDVRNGHLRFVLRLDDDPLLQTGGLIAFHLVGDAFLHAFKRDASGSLGDDDGVEGIPFDDLVSLRDGRAIVEEELRPVGDVVVVQHDLGVRVDDAELGQTTDYDLTLVALRVYYA